MHKSFSPLVQLEALKQFIVTHYDGLVAIGGADIHPKLYDGEDWDMSEANESHSRTGDADGQSDNLDGSEQNGNPAYFREIDEFEWDLIESWLDVGRGTIFGICRGHQLLGVMHGASLCKDIESEFPQAIQHTAPVGSAGGSCSACKGEGPKDISHGGGAGGGSIDQATSSASSWHEIVLLGRNNALYRAVRKDAFAVNSRHHQAIMRTGCRRRHGEQFAKLVDVIAVSEDVIEAAELKNGRGFSVQFHPEDMNNEDGDAIMRMMVEMTRERWIESACSVPGKIKESF